MTSEEKSLIADCRIMVIGATNFIDCVKAELDKSGFKSINIVSANNGQVITDSIDMIAEYVGDESSCVKVNATIPIIRCEGLQFALPAIRDAKTSELAQRTAAHICARIAANIAVGRDVKHFPRFYLSKNLE